MNEAPIYLFDDVCVLCSRGVHYVLKYETQPDIRFVSIQSKEGRKLAQAHNINPDDPHTFIYAEGDKIYTLSTAVLKLAKRVGGWGRWFLWTEIIPKPIRDWVYSRIANNRYRLFGKLDHCYVPSSEDRHRFVLS